MMNAKARFFTTILGAGAAAAAIAVAPVASAAGVTTTHESGSATTTQRPGHVSIYTEPAPVSPPQIWGSSSTPTWLLGD